MKSLVINADDLGIDEAANRAMAIAFSDGVLTSASMMATGPAFAHAIKHVVEPNPGLGVGLHLSLTSGTSVLPADDIPLLVDHEGRFRRGFFSLWSMLVRRQDEARCQIDRELAAQFARFRAAGLRPDHIDSHRHVHMIPAIFVIVARLARQHECPVIRIPDERLLPFKAWMVPSRWRQHVANLPKKVLLNWLASTVRHEEDRVNCAEHTRGVLGSGSMNRRSILKAISNLSAGVTEIITHPADNGVRELRTVVGADRRFWQSPARQSELQALLDPVVRDAVVSDGIRLGSFPDVLRPQFSLFSCH